MCRVFAINPGVLNAIVLRPYTLASLQCRDRVRRVFADRAGIARTKREAQRGGLGYNSRILYVGRAELRHPEWYSRQVIKIRCRHTSRYDTLSIQESPVPFEPEEVGQPVPAINGYNMSLQSLSSLDNRVNQYLLGTT